MSNCYYLFIGHQFLKKTSSFDSPYSTFFLYKQTQHFLFKQHLCDQTSIKKNKNLIISNGKSREQDEFFRDYVCDDLFWSCCSIEQRLHERVD